MYVIGINGPPGSGKDTLARMIAEEWRFKTEDSSRVLIAPLSLSLRRIAYSMTGGVYNLDSYEAFKREIHQPYNVSGRQLMIDVSERFLKKTYNPAILVDLWLKYMHCSAGLNDIVIIPDCGFQSEWDALQASVGLNHTYLVRMSRDECSYENDSRSLITSSYVSEVANNGTLVDLQHGATELCEWLQSSRDWSL